MSKLCQGPWQASRLLLRPGNLVHTSQRAVNLASAWDAKFALVNLTEEVVQSVLLLDRCNLIGWGFGQCLIDEGAVDSFNLWIVSNLDIWACTDKIDHRSRHNRSSASHIPWLSSHCRSSHRKRGNSHLLLFHVECNAIEISLGNLHPIHDGPANSFAVSTEELDIKEHVLMDLHQRSNNTVGIEESQHIPLSLVHEEDILYLIEPTPLQCFSKQPKPGSTKHVKQDMV